MLFCEPNNGHPVAMLAGILCALLFVPSIADKQGRRDTYCLSLAVSLLAQFGLLVSDQAELSLVFTFMTGAA